jgi:transcriptional regulator with GAF, ATPase, and Fis domain
LTVWSRNGYHGFTLKEGTVKRRVDLIDQFADLVVGADDPRHLAERTLEVVMSLTNGRSGAVFTLDSEKLTLFASRGIDQHVLDAIQTVWSRFRPALEKGETFYVSERSSDPRLPRQEERQGPASFAVVPVFDADHLVALLYVDSHDPHFCTDHDIERMAKFSRIVAKAVADTAQPAPGAQTSERVDGWEAYLERTPVEDLEREKLLLLLNRNEWNIARVSRLMGVTRRTIYLRLQRYNIPRERVRKTRLRAARA